MTARGLLSRADQDARWSGWYRWPRIPTPAGGGGEWERNPHGVALLPAGRRWDVLILPGELGHPTLDVLTRSWTGPARCSPISATPGWASSCPPGTGDPLARHRRTRRGRRDLDRRPVPGPGRPAGCAGWCAPDGQGTLTDPSLLELAMHEAAARDVAARRGARTES